MTTQQSILQWTPAGYELPVFPAVTPDAAKDGSTERVKIAIVGGGLSGLTLAADLATRGVEAVLLDEDDTVGVRGASSRGMVWAQKTLEIMDRLGVAHRMIEKGVTWSIGKTLSGDEIIYSFNRAEGNASLAPSFVNLQQFYVEWFLVERIQALGKVELRWRNAVKAIHPGDSSARLEVESPGGRYTIEADWVIDATGANSPLRAHLKLETNPARHVDRWCICDARCEDLDVPERWTWVDAPFNEGRAVWQHMMADKIWRLDYQLAPDSDPDMASRPDVAAERVRAHLGPDVKFELIWVGPWAYRTQMLEQFRVGRILFVGDSAHVMSPFGARGGNSGIQDADNLGWKLALVQSGRAHERLLDSYDAERRPAAAENIRVTSRTTRFLAPQSPFEHRLREAVLSLARQHPFARALVNTGRLSTPNIYQPSDIIGGSGGFALPNVALHDGAGRETSLSELMRSIGASALGLYLPRAGDDPQQAAIAALSSAAFTTRTLGAEFGGNADLIDAAGHVRAATGAKPGDLVIVRPDLYCADVVANANEASALRALKAAVAQRDDHAP